MVRSLFLALTGCAVLSAGLSASPAAAERAASARLVHCGKATCLRLSGRRDGAATELRVDGRVLSVVGERSWQVTVPLAQARTWRLTRGYAVPITLVDRASGAERMLAVPVPPGALGARVELASLIVRAR
ncbi:MULTISPECIES: hypothetical protein [unclassified Sphingomonas]|uniref:hypothetical protein n=1 Tax=unclassified Sphingomonas TaxID=196159 RepID=UPI001619B55A|nr:MULTISPECIES: hypothetical protein [unclassified Sphingomonas]MBB3349230.1 hypothetical protein [Sphingomonas sp. BK069]MBB3474324.1 hypothetical protein [Sphingomonas sp. BK345]